MTLNIFVYKDKRLGVYSMPIFKSEPPTAMAALVTRTILTADNDDKNIKALVGREFIHLGTFNDDTADFNLCSTVLLDTDKVFAQRAELDKVESQA